MATTFGALSEPYWKETEAVAIVPAETPQRLAEATEQLLADERNAVARTAAAALYAARFEPAVALAPLFEDA